MLVIFSVALGVASSVIMNEAAHWKGVSFFVTTVAVAVAMAMNVARFGLWGFIYRKWQVSSTYPLTSLFFPAVFLVDVLMYGMAVSAEKIVGTTLITVGIVTMMLGSPESPESAPSDRINSDG